MPQWQFKLFEFDVIDFYPHDHEESKRGRDNKKFVVQMFGIDTEGKTACIYVTGFDPFFYVKVPDEWNESNMMEFTNYVKGKMGRYYEDSLVKPRLLKRQKLYGFDNKKVYNFIKFKFKNMPAFNKAKNIWFIDTSTPTQYNRTLIEGGIEYGDERLEIYESQIPPLLRLFHIQEISPSGWIALQNNRFTEHKKRTTTCNYEFSVKYNEIVSLSKREKGVPYNIMSVDVEASSSHGEFPLPKKNYKKLAKNIVELIEDKKIEPDKELLKKCIYTGFGLDNQRNIQIVYPKKKPTQDEIDEMFEEWINSCPTQYSKLKMEEELKNQLEEENNNDDNDDDIEDEMDNEEDKTEPSETFYAFKFTKRPPKKYNKKNATIIEMLLDKEAERDTKIQELTTTLTAIFPELEGDRVTIIGTSFRRNGEVKPFLKHGIVIGDCAEVDGVELECYKTEREALLAWTDLVQRINPDIMIGYNIHGWDCGFLHERAKELNCEKQFLKLSRNKNEVCLKKDWKTGREDIENNTLVIASGQYDLKYYKMTGRLQIDLLNVFRREETLSSYKLDYVSGYFIGDDIKAVEASTKDENQSPYTLIKTKNLIGVENGDYIVIEMIGHTTDLYQGGKKMKISNLDEVAGTFTVDGHIDPDKTKKLRWCLGKDDVTPQEIFRLTNEGPEGRAIVLKYCIKDTTLVHDLMRKVDIMTGYIEMAKLSWVPMSFLVYRGQGIKLTSYVAQKCREKNTLMPVIEKKFDDEGYEGAFVLVPDSGLYLEDPVACVDYSSLYPSSIISENLSHDSKLWTKEYNLEGELIESWYSVEGMELPPEGYGYDYVDVTYDTFKWLRRTPKAAKTKEKSGYKTCRFVQFAEGEKAILPAILEELLGARKATKKQMKNEQDPFMCNVLDKRQLAIKVTANSLYGQCGAKTSPFFEKDVAASTTATGRKLLMYAKSIIETNFGDRIIETKKDGQVKTKAKTVYGDSVAGNTPVYIRINKEKIDICTIEELANKYGNSKWELCEEDGKEDKLVCQLENIESWSEIGWTKCHRIIKHQLAPEKKMLRILTHTGLVDVTDDHSLVKNTGEMISPKDVEIGTKLLHKTMEINDVNNDITIEEAKIMGFFFGDGSCGSYNCKSGSKSSWALNNSDSNLLNKYLDLCKVVYPEFEWKIYDTIKSSGVNKLTFTVKNRGDKVKFIKRYREELYNNNSKKIPNNILNSNKEIREAFWEGLYDADGDKDKNGYTRIDQKSQLSASHICWLANSIGYKTSINIRNDKQNIYRITATKNYQRKDPDMVKKIVELDNVDRDLKGVSPFNLDVYDLTTANHHFAAGIGNMIVHNTDSVFFNLNLHDMDGNKITGKKALELTIEISQHVSNEANTNLKAPHDLEYEKTFLPFCLLSKKRYVGMLFEFDPEKSKRKSMGIVLKRRDNAPIVKDIYGGVIDILMKEKNIYKSIEYVKKCLQELVDGNCKIEKLTITKSLRSYYKNPMQIAHNVLAKRMGERDAGNQPGPGDRIPFAYIKNENKKALQGEKIENPKYILDNSIQLDYGFYITNQIMKPLQQIYALPNVLENMSEFKLKRGLQDYENPHGAWKKEIDKLKEKWTEEEKFKKKLEEFRCKEVKSILFDPFIEQLK